MKDLKELKDSFNSHVTEDSVNFREIHKRLDDIMLMLKPIYDAFDFKNKLEGKGKAWLINSTKVVALLLALFTLLGIMWAMFKYAIISAGK